ncbi:MAG: formate--tetrahydrofolate ligase, partial [Rhizomicrobium sp.]
MNDVSGGRGPKTDWEIAQEATLLPILDVAAKLGIPSQSVEPFGHYKAKIGM